MPSKIVYKQSGFTYPLVLIMCVAVSLLAGVTNLVTSHYVKREKEVELLFIGQQYINAIESYYEAGSIPRYPNSIEDLLKDPRFIEKKHLRRFYRDPMYPLTEDDQGWSLVKNAQGQLIGIASQSQAQPIKINNFPIELESFEQAEHYSDWKFIYIPEISIQLGNPRRRATR